MRKFIFRVLNLASHESDQIVAGLGGVRGVVSARFDPVQERFIVQFETAQTSALELTRFVSGLRGPNEEPFRVEPIGIE